MRAAPGGGAADGFGLKLTRQTAWLRIAAWGSALSGLDETPLNTPAFNVGMNGRVSKLDKCLSGYIVDYLVRNL